MAIDQLTFLSSLLLLSSLIVAEEQYPIKLQSSSPHGLLFENPMPFPPSAYDFFHPNTNAATTPATAPLSSLYPGKTSSRARADAAVATSVFSVPSGHHRIGAAGVAALVAGLGLVLLVVMITSFFIIKRRAETKKTNATMINVA